MAYKLDYYRNQNKEVQISSSDSEREWLDYLKERKMLYEEEVKRLQSKIVRFQQEIAFYERQIKKAKEELKNKESK
ncbi:hypothetical protein J7L48_08695 [bacterium]|nr:hypothetical protein [bacterium]